MVFKLRNTPSPKQPIPPRHFAGLSLSNDATRIDAAVVAVHGQGSGVPLEICQTLAFDLPPDVISLYDEVLEVVAGEEFKEAATYLDGFPRSVSVEIRQRLIREMSGIEEEAFEELASETRIPRSEIMALGVHDPGIRAFTAQGQNFESLCSPDLLALRTGMNIVDAFPLRDIAAEGQGGPVFGLPTWVLLKSDLNDRILLDLGKAARMTRIPKSFRLTAAKEINYRDIVPCGLLLDALTYQLTKGEMTVDQGGKLTVQGRQIPELLDFWRNLATKESVWNPYGISPSPYLEFALGRAGEKWALRDILCTATHLIVDEIADAVRSMVRQDAQAGTTEIVLTGGARRHGMLLNLLSQQLCDYTIVPMSQLGMPHDSFDAVCTAILAMMFVDQIPSNLPHLTGADTSVPLGRLTPGNPAAWQNLLQSMASAKPVHRSLRSAI